MDDDRAFYRQWLRELGGGKITVYYPGFAQLVGGVKAALLLSQLLYWNSTRAGERAGETGQRAPQGDGWFYKSVEDLQRETGMTKCEQQTARRSLAEVGVIDARLRGVPRVWYYRVNLQRLVELAAGAADDLPLADDLPEADNQPVAEGELAEEKPVEEKPAEKQPAAAGDWDDQPVEDHGHAATDLPAAGNQPEEINLPLEGAVPWVEPGSVGPPLDGKPAQSGKQTAPTLGGNPSQFNKVSENTTEINKKLARPRDPRLDHPAVILIKAVTGISPPKVVMNRVIRVLGDMPESERFAEIHETWCARGYRPTNLEGQLDWYLKGIPPAVQPARAGRPGTQAPLAKPLVEDPRSESELADLRERLRATKR